MRFQEVIQANGTHTDEHGRLAAHRTDFLKDVSINPDHVVKVVAVPSRIVEGAGEQAIPLCKIMTLVGETVVLGSQQEVEKKIFGDTRQVLKG